MKVAFVGDLDEELPEYKDFALRHECVRYHITTKEQLLKDFGEGGELANIDAIYGAWLGFVVVGGFTEDIAAAAPKLLKVVAVCSVGHNDYDGEGMAKHDIILTNVPLDGAAGPVTDLVVYYTINAFRQFTAFTNALSPEHNQITFVRRWMNEANKWDTEKGKPRFTKENAYSFGHHLNDRPVISPRGHKVVIVGFGNIGRTIGKSLHHLGMEIHYVKRSKLSDDEEKGLGYPTTYHASIKDATFADLVVIAAPLTPETKHLIDAKQIEAMEKPFRLINIGRGAILDEQAVVDGLKLGKILFAGLDVFEHEPKVHPDLYGRDDVVLTPHIASLTKENFDHTSRQAMANIDDVLSGGTGITRVN